MIKPTLALFVLVLAACSSGAAQPQPSPSVTTTTEVVYVPVTQPNPPSRTYPKYNEPQPFQPPQYQPPPAYAPTSAPVNTPPGPNGLGYTWTYQNGRWCTVPAPGYNWSNGPPAATACPH